MLRTLKYFLNRAYTLLSIGLFIFTYTALKVGAIYYPTDNITNPTCAPGASGCYVSLLPDQTSKSGSLLFSNGTNPAWSNPSALNWDSVNGWLAVGTNTPITPLDVYNSSFRQMTVRGGNNASQVLNFGTVANTVGSYISNNSFYHSSFNFTPGYTASSGMMFRQDGSIEFFTDTGLTSGVDYNPTERMYISNTGNVGIGAAGGPLSQPLVVGRVGALPETSGSTSSAHLKLFDTSSASMYFGVNHTGQNQGWIQMSANADMSQTFPLLLNPNGGNVGIGTTTPTERLSVTGGTLTTAGVFKTSSTAGDGTTHGLNTNSILLTNNGTAIRTVTGLDVTVSGNYSGSKYQTGISSTMNIAGKEANIAGWFTSVGTATGSGKNVGINAVAYGNTYNVGVLASLGTDYYTSNFGGVSSAILASSGSTGNYIFLGYSGNSTVRHSISDNGNTGIISGNTTGTTTSSALSVTANSLTTGTGIYAASSTLTSGALVDLAVTGTAGLTNQKGINVSLSGANGTGAQTTYGGYFSNIHTGTSNNVGLYSTATGGTNNYAAIFELGNVGIGTTTPTAKLTVVGGAIMPAIGNSASAGILFPTDPGGGSGDEAYIRYYIKTGEDTRLIIGNNNDAADDIQINTQALLVSYLTSCGGVQTNGTGTMSCTSDERLKDIQGDFTKGLDAIRGINPKAFSWKQDSNMYDGGVIYNGFIAQNIQSSLPEAVTLSSDGVHLQVSQLTLLAASINAIKELDIKVNQQSSLDTTLDGSFGYLAKEFLGNINNKIDTIFAKKVKTEELCIKDTCVTEDQLKALLNNVQINQVSQPQIQPQASDPIIPPADTPPDNTQNEIPVE